MLLINSAHIRPSVRLKASTFIIFLRGISVTTLLHSSMKWFTFYKLLWRNMLPIKTKIWASPFSGCTGLFYKTHGTNGFTSNPTILNFVCVHYVTFHNVFKPLTLCLWFKPQSDSLYCALFRPWEGGVFACDIFSKVDAWGMRGRGGWWL